MPKLIIPQGPRCEFYAPGDEAAFFVWLHSIPGVISVQGVGQSLEVTLRSLRMSDVALRELIGLYKRYGLPMKDLAQFETARSRKWFRNSSMFWHKSVFGAP